MILKTMALALLLLPPIYGRADFHEAASCKSEVQMHICKDEAFAALWIALEQPLNLVRWTNGHFFLEPRAILHDRSVPYLRDDYSEIPLPHLMHDEMCHPFLNVTFEEFYNEAEAHLSREQIDSPPSSIRHVLRVYCTGASEIFE